MDIIVYTDQGVSIAIPGAELTRNNSLGSPGTLTISYQSQELVTYKAGAFVTVEGETFYLMDDYIPSDSSDGFNYAIVFDDLTALFQKIEFYFEDATGTKQYTWTISANLDTIAQLIGDAIQRDAPELEVAMGQVKSGTSNIDITFDGMNVLEAISHTASNFETEWWMYSKSLNLDKALFNSNTPLILRYGENINDDLTVENTTGIRAQFIRARGGTTNMPVTAEALVRYTSHLPMPEGFEVIEVEGVRTGVTSNRSYPDIFPEMRGAVTEVDYNGESENPIYLIRTSLTTPLEDLLAAGKVPKIRFTSGILNGREFEIGATSKEGVEYLEIFRVESGGIYIPRPYLDPRVNDEFMLIDVKVSQEAIHLASQRLLVEVQEDAKNLAQISPNISGTAYYPDDTRVGCAVEVHHPAIQGGYTSSRIIGSSYLIGSMDQVSLIIGDSVSQGSIQSIRDDLDDLTSSVEQGQTSGGTNDARYLRKDVVDEARGLIRFRKGLTSDSMRSSDYREGGFSGAGYTIDKREDGTHGEIDFLTVRKSMNVFELVINQINFSFGETVLSRGGFECTGVEDMEDRYRCYYDNKNKARYSGIKTNDFVRVQRFDPTFSQVIKYYTRMCIGIGDDYVDLAKSGAAAVHGVGIPTKGDNCVQWGNLSDKTRQWATIRSVIGGGYDRILFNINSVSSNGEELYYVGKADGSDARIQFGNENMGGLRGILKSLEDGTPDVDLDLWVNSLILKKPTGNISVESEIDSNKENTSFLLSRENLLDNSSLGWTTIPSSEWFMITPVTMAFADAEYSQSKNIKVEAPADWYLEELL